ncbi:MAG: hypothetical protein HC915_14630 [Anaerolineae bacterium]|nr:hypothetical protein [Anaerolineae bacterium]
MAIIGMEWLWVMPILFTGGIYLYYSNKSALVKFHARQALALQVLGTFGWLLLLASGTAVWIVLLIASLILIVVVIGLLLAPLVALAYPVFILASFALPLSVLVLGLLGAVKVWNGEENFRYPSLADLLDRYLGRIQPDPISVV